VKWTKQALNLITPRHYIVKGMVSCIRELEHFSPLKFENYLFILMNKSSFFHA